MDSDEDHERRKQELLRQLGGSKSSRKSKRYYEDIQSNQFVDESEEEEEDDISDDEADYNGLKINMNVDDEEDADGFLAIEDGSRSDDDSQINASADDDNESDDADSECDPEELLRSKQEADKALSKLSELEFEKLLSHTMANLAHKLELSEQKNSSLSINPFVTMDDEIALETDTALNIKELVSFIPDHVTNDIDDETRFNFNSTNDPDGEFSAENINNPSDFHTITAFEKSHCMFPDPKTSSSNHPSNLRASKLTTTMLSEREKEENSFIREEIRLARQTMNKAITRRMSIERKNFAPPLSQKDKRIQKKRKRENAGKGWFNMPAGKLTPQNKLHFLMMKYRHMIYRKYKPAKVKDDFVPKFFQMGTIVEGPTEWYSDRMLKRNRRKSWAQQFMADPEQAAWLLQKKRRAQRRIRNPENVFWAPMRKMSTDKDVSLRKQLTKQRRMRQRRRDRNNHRNWQKRM